ncbi:MAG: reverse transcriptase domain-containing protein, partial [Acidimicrobiales bacterium]
MGIPAMTDRAMQSWYLLARDPVAEVRADPHSYGVRVARAPADAIAHCCIVLSNRFAPQWIREGDIRACFDRMSHAWLVAHVPMDTAILRLWLKAGYMEKRILHPTDEGAPQGGPISPVVANLTLNGLETLLRDRFPRTHEKSQTKVNGIRFADDFIITGASREVREDEVTPLVDAFMRERGLELSSAKTVITHIAEGFDFLGQHVRQYDGKLLITPSKKRVKALLDKIRALVKATKQAKTGTLILHLNSLLRGWAQYHRHVVSKETFAAVDAAVFKLMWRGATRRHPGKGARWVRKTYVRTQRVPPVGRLGGDGREGRSGSPRPPLLDAPRAHHAPHESATRSDPLRPGVGGRLRGAPECDHEGHLGRGTAATLLMGGATGPLPDLRPDDHDTDGVGR